MGSFLIFISLFIPALVFIPIGVELKNIFIIIGGIYAGIPAMFGMAWAVEVGVPFLFHRDM